MKLLTTLLASKDVTEHVTSVRDNITSKIQRGKNVRDMIRDGKSTLDLLNLARKSVRFGDGK